MARKFKIISVTCILPVGQLWAGPRGLSSHVVLLPHSTESKEHRGTRKWTRRGTKRVVGKESLSGSQGWTVMGLLVSEPDTGVLAASPEDVMTIFYWLHELAECSQQHNKMSTAISSLYDRKRRLREVAQFSQGHTAHKQQSREIKTRSMQCPPATE